MLSGENTRLPLFCVCSWPDISWAKALIESATAASSAATCCSETGAGELADSMKWFSSSSKRRLRKRTQLESASPARRAVSRCVWFAISRVGNIIGLRMPERQQCADVCGGDRVPPANLDPTGWVGFLPRKNHPFHFGSAAELGRIGRASCGRSLRCSHAGRADLGFRLFLPKWPLFVRAL